jgi:hypothetical protein
MTTASAMAMWHVVEKKWLLRNNHYVAANAAPGRRPPGDGGGESAHRLRTPEDHDAASSSAPDVKWERRRSRVGWNPE